MMHIACSVLWLCHSHDQAIIIVWKKNLRDTYAHTRKLRSMTGERINIALWLISAVFFSRNRRRKQAAKHAMSGKSQTRKSSGTTGPVHNTLVFFTLNPHTYVFQVQFNLRAIRLLSFLFCWFVDITRSKECTPHIEGSTFAVCGVHGSHSDFSASLPVFLIICHIQ